MTKKFERKHSSNTNESNEKKLLYDPIIQRKKYGAGKTNKYFILRIFRNRLCKRKPSYSGTLKLRETITRVMEE